MARLLVVAVCAVAVVFAPASADGKPTTLTAKKCRKGYKRVRVRHGRHSRYVCRKVKKKVLAPVAPTPPTDTQPTAPTDTAPSQPTTPSAPAGPSVADVEKIIRDGLQAQHLAFLGPESIEVIFEQPTQVLAPVSYDPYAADPLHAGGAIQAWPVRAWVKSINHHDTTPADDTHYAGCDGHLDSVWPHDQLYMFYASDAGGWAFKTTPAPGAVGTC
jgi:hypothetical protein